MVEVPPDGVTVDSVAVVTSFTLFFPLPLPLPLSFLPLLGGPSLLVSLNQQSRSNLVSVHQFCSSPCPCGSCFLVKASISMSSGPLLLLGDTVTPA